jgi:ferredoxin
MCIICAVGGSCYNRRWPSFRGQVNHSGVVLMYVVTVDVAKCGACGDCVDTCPDELIALVEEHGKQFAMYRGDPDDCIGCYSCESGCQEGAITITEL